METGNRSSYWRRLFWFVTVTIALSGFWFTLGAWGYIGLDHEAPRWPLVLGVLALGSGLIGWSLYEGRTIAYLRFAHALLAFMFSIVALIPVGFLVAYLTFPPCSLLRPAALLIPASYYALGYAGFSRPRRLLWGWPLAVVAGLSVYLVLDLIWRANSGCT